MILCYRIKRLLQQTILKYYDNLTFLVDYTGFRLTVYLLHISKAVIYKVVSKQLFSLILRLVKQSKLFNIITVVKF